MKVIRGELPSCDGVNSDGSPCLAMRAVDFLTRCEECRRWFCWRHRTQRQGAPICLECASEYDAAMDAGELPF